MNAPDVQVDDGVIEELVGLQARQVRATHLHAVSPPRRVHRHAALQRFRCSERSSQAKPLTPRQLPMAGGHGGSGRDPALTPKELHAAVPASNAAALAHCGGATMLRPYGTADGTAEQPSALGRRAALHRQQLAGSKCLEALGGALVGAVALRPPRRRDAACRPLQVGCQAGAAAAAAPRRHRRRLVLVGAEQRDRLVGVDLRHLRPPGRNEVIVGGFRVSEGTHPEGTHADDTHCAAKVLWTSAQTVPQGRTATWAASLARKTAGTRLQQGHGPVARSPGCTKRPL